MRYNTLINNVKCLKWGLNVSEGALMDLFNQVHTWAKSEIIDNQVFYFVARQKVIEELPLFYSKTDTVYRHFKKLNDIGLINYCKSGKRDLIQLTDKGKSWNSEMNPRKLGNESEFNSEMNPTYNNTNIDNNTKDKGASNEAPPKSSIKFLKSEILKNELELKFPSLSIPEEIEKMTDWLKANGKRKKDYAAFARTWCRNDVKYNKENNKRNGNGTRKRDYDEAEQTRIAISAAEQVLADRRAKAAFYS
jgi:hypothetical protein